MVRLKVIALVTGVCLLAVLPAAAQASFKTKASIYYAYTSSGTVKFKARAVSGYCWVGSLTVNRKDAWRCFVGNYIYDPCFSSSLDLGYVACPDARLTKGVKIHLSKKLPRKYANHGAPSLSDEPWNIETSTYRHYVFSSGASNVVDGKRANYFAPGRKGVLWGFPNRTHEPWRILWAPLSATSLDQHVRIRHVWM
jgi:hypothetical protein